MAKNAICVGINDYPGTDSDLAGCVNDANDWASQLAARGFTVVRILDRSATRRNLIQQFQSLIGSAVSGDSLVIHYSGHGSFVPDLDGDEPDGTDECLCPHDVVANGPITDDELFSVFSQTKEGVRLVMLSDSCHSGSVTRFAPIKTPPSVRGKPRLRRRVRFLPPAVFLSARKLNLLGKRRPLRASNPPGRYASLLMSGCQDTELASDAYFNGRANGAFSYVALKSLRSLPASTTYLQWFLAIRKLLPSSQYPQSPNLYGLSAMKNWVALQ